MKRIFTHIAILMLLSCSVIQLSAQTFPSIQQEIRLFNVASSQYIGLLPPSNLGSTYSLTLPGNQGANGQVMVNNGSGVLSWITPLTSSSGWALLGNSGTSVATNFLGTTDNLPLAIRTSNTERLRVTADGLVLIGSTSGSNTLNVTGTLGVTGLITGSGGATLTGTTQINTTGTSVTSIGSTTASVTIGSVSGAVKSSVGSNDRIVLANSSGTLDQASISSVLAAGINSSAWALTGNNGTNASTNYIGTSDSVDLVFRTAGTERMRIVNTSGQLSTSNDATINGVRVGRGGGNAASNTNTAVGANALTSNTSGVYNTAVGNNALNASTGSDNTAIGFWALQSNTIGRNNTATGSLSMNSNIGGSWNTSMGHYSMRYGTDGDGNTALGAFALYNNKTGSENTAVGYGAGRSIAGGLSVNDTVNTSVFIGNATKSLANNQSNQIVIGFDATGLGSNTVVLGNNSIVTTALKGNVLINNSGANIPGAVRFLEGSTGGSNYIGMRAPNNLASDFTYTLPATAPTAGQVLSSAADGTMSWVTALTSASGWGLTGNSSIDSTINYIGTTDEAVGRPLVIRTDGSERMRVLGGSGLVGIGTSGPTAQLQVTSTAAARSALRITAASGQTADLVTIANSGGTSMLRVGPTAQLRIGPFNSSEASSDLPLRVMNSEAVAGATERDIFYGQLDHTAQDPTFRFGLSNYDAADVSNARSQLTIKLRDGTNTVDQANTVMTLRSQGFVGINASSPAAALVIRPSSNASANLVEIATSGGSNLFTVGSSGALTLLPFGTSAGNTNEMRFTELAAGGTHYVGFKAPDAIASNRIWTLPSADGTSGQILSTNGSGVLSWSSALTSTSGWSTTGNSSLDASSNFLGTIDSVDVVFRHFNTEKVRVTRHGLRVVQSGTPIASQWVASFQNIGNPTYLELLNSSDGGGMYMGMRGNGNVGDTATIWNWQGGPLAFYTGPGNKGSFLRMMITPNGDVGIGSHNTTFNIAARLHVRGGNVLIDTVGTTSGQLLFRNPQGTASTSIRAGFQTSDINYWLPATAPSSNGQVLTSNTAGVMSWADMGSQAWSLIGNSGTSASTNFIGTTDPVDLVLKRNDTERARVTAAGLRVIQNGTPRNSTWTLSVQNITTAPTMATTALEFLNSTAAVDGGGGFVGLKGTGSVGDTMGVWNHQGGPIIFSTSTANRDDIPRMRIAANGNVAVGNTTAGTLLDVDGGLTVRPGATTNVTADNQAVTIGNRSHVVLSSNGTPANRTITISNGLQTGQILFIMVTGTAATNGIELADNPGASNTNLSGLAQLVDGAVLQLIWNGTDWMEVTRSNN